MAENEDRCRLVLIAPDNTEPAAMADMVGDALRGGDVATLILPQYGLDEHAFQKMAETVVPIAQRAGVAAVIAGDSRVAGRAKADGLHISEGPAALAEAVGKFSPRLIVGAGGIKDRHAALEIGEHRPDYIFFGRLDGDIKPEAHDKTAALGEWWASMVEIPCIAMAGNSIASALTIADTGAEFVAMRMAVFADPRGPAQAVAEVNALLAEKAPRFET
jgi:thiamine-phosphate pyrophosphorylase